MLKTYDASEVSVIFGTRALSGLAEGTFVNVARDEDSFTKQVGADGEVTRSKTNNKSGSIEITLQQGSADNAYLSNLQLLDENTGNGVQPVLVKDGSGNSLHGGREAWIRKPADAGYGRDAGERTYIIDVAELDTLPAGN